MRKRRSGAGPPGRRCIITSYRIAEDVAFREVDGEIIALNLKSGQYYTLNEVGTRMWTLLTELDLVESIVKAIVAEYDATPEQVEQDLASLLEALAVNGLVEKN